MKELILKHKLEKIKTGREITLLALSNALNLKIIKFLFLNLKQNPKAIKIYTCEKKMFFVE